MLLLVVFLINFFYYLITICNKQLDNFGVELDIVQIGHGLLFGTENSRPKTCGQIRRGHFILTTMCRDLVQMSHEQLERLEIGNW